ncbi:MAG: hypothetical protein HOP18_26760 [Deltaproteobacteria bacterium]|nr:hypothetical protein [Deltaproteobacteria bacterium]
MAFRNDERSRFPGPLGTSPVGIGGRYPGPLGFHIPMVMGPKVMATMVKTLKMPPPAADSKTKTAHEVTYNLFNESGPVPGDVQQTGLANCSMASILAALAHTKSGRKRLQGMITEHPIAVVTDLSAVPTDPNGPSIAKTILSKRYFTVTLGETAIEVSDVFYTDDADRNWSLTYMRSPYRPNHTDALWSSVIEKAYAVQVGGYTEVDKETNPAIFWKMLMGSDPKHFPIDETTDLSDISAVVKAAPRVTTIATSREGAPDVLTWHGFAVLRLRGLEDPIIELYEPMMATTIKISPKKFRSNFTDIFHA